MQVPKIFFSYRSNNKFNKPSNYASYPNLRPLAYDTISFGAKKDFNKEIQNLAPESFPSEGLREFILSRIQDGKNKKNIFELHKEYYIGLKDCKTLDEAKKMYSEFNCVIDAKNIDIDKLAPKDIFKSIANNKIKGAKLETISLEFLKRYYANLCFPSNEEAYYDISTPSIKKILSNLNIAMNDKYLGIIYNEMRSERMAKLHQDPDFEKAHKQRTSERMKKLHQNPEFKKGYSERMKKLHQDPEFKKALREKSRETMAKLHQDPEFEKAFRQRSKETMAKLYQDPNYKEKMKIVYMAKSLANKIHPFAHSARVEIAKGFPYLSTILSNQEKRKLSNKEKAYLKSYLAEIHNKYPKLDTEIGVLQRKILQNWGFYEKGENAKSIEELMQIATKALENAAIEDCFDEV